jgi:hypothetical protein
MQHTVRPLIVLAVAAALFSAPVVHAQDFGPPPPDPVGPAQPVGPPPSQPSVPTPASQPPVTPTVTQPGVAVFPPGGSTYRFWDQDGWGVLTVQYAGTAWYTSAALIQVRLTQNGRIAIGSGVVVGNRIYFTLLGYFFQGQTPGWGSYHYSLGHPGYQWRFYLQ